MKFISELDMSKPGDVEEMRRHVFGQHYSKGANGQPVEEGRGSRAQIASGNHRDSTDQHERAKARAAAERQSDSIKLPQKVPKGSDI